MIPGMVVNGKDAIYHVITKNALSAYVLGGVEKDYLVIHCEDNSH